MALAMTRPWKHPTTGIYWLRKAVPADLRETLGKREEKFSLKTRDQSEAKIRLNRALADIEIKWASLRRGPTTISERQANELEDEFYRMFVARHVENPSRHGWNIHVGALLEKPDALKFESGHVRLNMEIPLGVTALAERERLTEICRTEVEAYLDRKGMRVDESSHTNLVRVAGRALQRASLTLNEYAKGDFPRSDQASDVKAPLMQGSADISRALATAFTEMTKAAASAAVPLPLLQQIGDVQRNVTQRARRLRREIDAWDGSSSPAPFNLLPPGVCVRFVEAGLQPFVVLEWTLIESQAFLLVTNVDYQHAKVDIVEAPAINLEALAKDLRLRLANWGPTSRTDPLEMPDLSALSAWLKEVLLLLSPGIGHVVIIEHDELPLPLHVTVSRPWTVSYASDWRAAYDAAEASLTRTPTHAIGSITVPTFGERELVTDALKAAELALIEASSRHGVVVESIAGVEADLDAVLSILARSDAALVIAHGFLDAKQQEVALLVAAEGLLPPRSSVVAGSPSAAAHRLGYAALLSSGSVAPVLFLGVCAGGSVRFRGHGERVGLFPSFATIGAQAMVAPRWQIDAPLALPILSEIVKLWLDGTPLSIAVRRATDEAIARGVPQVVARAFAPEGAWNR